jgi:hypothetical protein
MRNAWKWLPAAVVAVLPISPDYAGSRYDIDYCGKFSLDCYHLEGPKWCQRTCSGYSCWTPVKVYNHTSVSEVYSAWQNFNYPPIGPANSLYLYSDGINNWSHDIDYNAFWSPFTNERAYVSWSSGYECFYLGSGYAEFNTFYLTGHFSLSAVAHHVTGHATGLDDNCDCYTIMNPYWQCDASDIITQCDADGEGFLYP